MENIREIRLKLLKRNFREKPYVRSGFKELRALIENKAPRLKSLLRNHVDEPIETDKEIIFRDKTDFLLAYYSLLMAGIIGNYIPPELDRKTIEEASMVLNNNHVRRYYESHYELYLPQLARYYLSNTPISRGDLLESADLSRQFEKFLRLYNGRIEDKDIDSFLWLLDDGMSYDENLEEWIDLGDLWMVFRKQRDLEKFLNAETPSQLSSAIWGFAKYVNYINAYADFHRSCDNHKLFASAIWHMDSYWFNNLETKLGDVVKEGIENINSLLLKNNYSKLNTEPPAPEILREWKRDSKKEIDIALESIDYLFDPFKGKLIKNLVRTLDSN